MIDSIPINIKIAYNENYLLYLCSSRLQIISKKNKKNILITDFLK